MAGKLHDLKLDTLETMRRYARLSVMYKMCPWFPEFQIEKGEHEEAIIDFIVPKGHKDILRFFSFPGQQVNGTNSR